MNTTPQTVIRFPAEFDLSWQDDAACAPVYKAEMNDLWHDPDEDFGQKENLPAAEKKRRQADRDRAKRICRDCPVRLECLTFAYENDERHGIWGGLDGRERTTLANKVRAGKAA